ncbi:ImmA/IrrE family metallo-endopeptidase [Staphylococcus nepalensis]|uniref:ImmA/IrrE family metallo-endopeptidase n=1 Tax=Staphylococcus nepalensis TaxID=214473 RepID=UPI000BC32C4B|nr:ImmA/IrrE family metallo-endopeptidase [Staphylococcus nepalensis]ATH60236.1 hypothetical protein BJD96_07925 [Staphylococcus nepalensis]
MKIESLVNNIIEELKTNGIDKSIDAISDYYNIIVFYNEHTSGYFIRKGFDVICIKLDTATNMWNDFTHELAHVMMHETNQMFMNELFNEKQENEADKFSLLFQYPQEEIEVNELFTEDRLVSYYNCSYQEARQRLTMLYNHFINAEMSEL